MVLTHDSHLSLVTAKPKSSPPVSLAATAAGPSSGNDNKSAVSLARRGEAYPKGPWTTDTSQLATTAVKVHSGWVPLGVKKVGFFIKRQCRGIAL